MRHLVIYVALAVVFSPKAALSDITRGCNCEYRIKVTHADGRPVSRDEVKFGRFTARGKCRGVAWANNCRRDARSYALGCTTAHWLSRWDRRRPAQCNNFGSVGPQDYGLEDLKANIEWHACFGGAAPGFSRDVTLQVRSVSWGDKRCAGSELHSNSYRVTADMCAAVDSKLERPPL